MTTIACSLTPSRRRARQGSARRTPRTTSRISRPAKTSSSNAGVRHRFRPRELGNPRGAAAETALRRVEVEPTLAPPNDLTVVDLDEEARWRSLDEGHGFVVECHRSGRRAGADPQFDDPRTREWFSKRKATEHNVVTVGVRTRFTTAQRRTEVLCRSGRCRRRRRGRGHCQRCCPPRAGTRLWLVRAPENELASARRRARGRVRRDGGVQVAAGTSRRKQA